MTDSLTSNPDSLTGLVNQARAGNLPALEQLVTALQPQTYNLALKFLWHPQDAEDACQEILIRIVTHLNSFRHDSNIRTWAYRVAVNHLLTTKKKRFETAPMGFDAFADDLNAGLDTDDSYRQEPDHALLLQEVKIGCTTALLLNLDRDHRMAYILGEILELDHQEAADAMDTSSATYRKRLSRARRRINDFMQLHCGLINTTSPCRCSRRVKPAIQLGRVDRESLLFTSSDSAKAQAMRFTDVLTKISQLEEDRRVAALYRSHPEQQPEKSMASWLRKLVETHGRTTLHH